MRFGLQLWSQRMTWPAFCDSIRPYRALGFSTVTVRMPAPYDRETIERMPEVAELLEG
jgi:hypothetical protein